MLVSQKHFLLSADKSLEPFRKVAVVENQRRLGLCKPLQGQFPQSALSVFLDVSSRLAVVHPHAVLCQYRRADETTHSMSNATSSERCRSTPTVSFAYFPGDVIKHMRLFQQSHCSCLSCQSRVSSAWL